MTERTANILIVEDERSMREILKMLLEGEGYNVVVAEDGLEGIKLIESDIYDLIITDIKMPGTDGFQILDKTQKVSPDSIVIMITAFGTTEAAVEAMKLGAYDYINKPFKIDEIRLIVGKALEKKRLNTEVSLLREQARDAFKIENIVGKSAAMQDLIRTIPKVGQGLSNVLITGESGTGKELVAAALNTFSPRADKPFVAVNCASLPEGLLESEMFGHMKGAFTGATFNKQGLFEIASGGTIFLDEIGEMPLNLQSKLLRVIESGTLRRVGGTTDIKIDVRIICATNRNLKKAVAEGLFREDLFYRLNVIPIHIPPLRERREDIPLYLDYFLNNESQGTKKQFTARALNILMNYSWKGNVRELENLVERVLLFADRELITEDELPDEIKHPPGEEELTPCINNGVDLEDLMSCIEKKYLIEALERAGGSKTEAAKLLGLSFRSFRHRLNKYDLN